MAQETLFPLYYKRQDPVPVDKDSVFATTAAMTAYLTDPVRYAGQIVGNNETGLAYMLNAARTAFFPIGPIKEANQQDLEGGQVTDKYVSPAGLSNWWNFTKTSYKPVFTVNGTGPNGAGNVAVIAPAGGDHGTVQVNNNGVVSGIPYFKYDFAAKKVSVGDEENSAELEIISDESVIESSSMLQYILPSGLTVAAVWKDTDGNEIMEMGTNSTNQYVNTIGVRKLDAKVFAPFQEAQCKLTTSAATKAYMKIPSGISDVLFDVSNDGNLMRLQIFLTGTAADNSGSYSAVATIVAIISRTGGVLTVDNKAAVWEKGVGTLAVEKVGETGVKIAITPAVATEINWAATTNWIKI
jgi:hypothetical protein